MKLLNETALLKYNGKVFVECLIELISKKDKIKYAKDYWKDVHPDEDFDDSKAKKYVKEYPIKDVKDDVHKFVSDFIDRLEKTDYVDSIMPDKSKELGFSEYIYVDFPKPKQKELQQYYNKNVDKYKHVKFRFSEHKPTRNLKKKWKEDTTKRPKDMVLYYDRSFLDASDEMKEKIKDYYNYIHYLETLELNYIRNKEDNKEESKKESFKRKKLRIYETLEEIAPSTYCTDSAKDIANWIVNKPKPYRILYDRTYDVWCIADAMSQTHKDMSIDMFDTDTKYLYGAARHLDDDIARMREEGKFNDGYTDAEVYSDYQFDHKNLVGMIFIPNNMNYRDYEESGFYEIQSRIKTGTIFTLFPFNSSGVFKDLYAKLFYMNALPLPLKQVFKNCYKTYGSDCIDEFYKEASEWGFSESEIQDFLDSSDLVSVI